MDNSCFLLFFSLFFLFLVATWWISDAASLQGAVSAVNCEIIPAALVLRYGLNFPNILSPDTSPVDKSTRSNDKVELFTHTKIRQKKKSDK